MDEALSKFIRLTLIFQAFGTGPEIEGDPYHSQREDFFLCMNNLYNLLNGEVAKTVQIAINPFFHPRG